MTGSMDNLAEETRGLHRKFEGLIEPHRPALWRYCRYLTGSPWDGEDLFQETLLKAFATMAQIWQPLAVKSYLFRIATHARIDGLRQRRVLVDNWADAEAGGGGGAAAAAAAGSCEMIEAVETLVQLLPARQIAVFLLMDVFGFTAAETGGMVRMTEGSVYAALHRARGNLRRRREEAKHPHAAAKRQPSPAPDAAVMNALLEALREGDAARIVGMLAESIHNDAKPGFQEYSKQDMLEGSLKHRGPALQVVRETLWGREVFVVWVEEETGPALHDIQQYETDGDRIVYHRGYYFCKELLLEAGAALGMPVQLQKAPNIDWR